MKTTTRLWLALAAAIPLNLGASPGGCGPGTDGGPCPNPAWPDPTCDPPPPPRCDPAPSDALCPPGTCYDPASGVCK